MIIKNNSTRLLITLPFLLILPFVQKQWINLYLFNLNEISFYSILYYLSGTTYSSLICLNSLDCNTYYKFNKKKVYSQKTFKGKELLFLVIINLIVLSYLIADYIYINIDFIFNLFLGGFKLQQPDIYQLSFFILLISILLIFMKSRVFLKKLILVNFILVSFFICYVQINNINVDDQFHIYNYFGLNDINLINVFILLAIEISYFMWSFISYKTNLSDWMVYAPQKVDMIPIVNIFIFYIFIIIYYLILM